MDEFIRARSPEQKAVRMDEIKSAAASLYQNVPYSEMTLTMIADRLAWTRANLYRYVRTKEDIFIELIEDAMGRYFDALDDALTATRGLPVSELADRWADVCVENADYMRYSGILTMVVADNVTEDRVRRFSDFSYRCSDGMSRRLADRLDCAPSHAMDLLAAVYFHGVGRTGLSHAEGAMRAAVPDSRFRFGDFRECMRAFILTHLEGAVAGPRL